MFDTSLIPGINSNVQHIMDDVASKKSNLDRAHANDALTLIRYGVLAWKGDGHGAQNVLEQVAGGKDNLSRDNASKAAAAMKSGALAIVAG